jgi:hypothetical protein
MKKILSSIENFFINHPFLIIFLGFLFYKDEFSTGEFFTLLAVCFLGAVYSYRVQKVYTEATNALSLNQWGGYKYYSQRLSELGAKHHEISDEEENLRYKEVANHIKKGGSAENFVPSNTLVNLKKELWKIRGSFKENEKRRNNMLGGYVNTIKGYSENISESWDFLNGKEEEPNHSDWKNYSATFEELWDSVADLK